MDTTIEHNLFEKLRRKEFNVTVLSEYIQKNSDRYHFIEKQLAFLPIYELEALGMDVLEFSMFIAQFTDRCDKLRERITEIKGETYAKKAEKARLVVWRSIQSKDYTTIKAVQRLLERYATIDFHVNDLTDCETSEELENKLQLYERFSKGQLAAFYEIGVPLFAVQDYQFMLARGAYENSGGIELLFLQNDNHLLSVGGKVHRYTDIRSIQGRKETAEAMEQCKASLGIHPANLTLLLFLKISQCLKHTKITISGSASRMYNYRDVDSNFYLLPRNYFRLKLNHEIGKYEFDGDTRDQLLNKFAKKKHIVTSALELMEQYFISSTTTSSSQK